MDLKILETAGKVAGIGGLALAVFLLLFMAAIKNTSLFSRMDAEQTYRTIRHFLYLTFTIAALGLVAWIFAQFLDSAAPTPREVSFIGQEVTPERLPATMTRPPSNEHAGERVKELSARDSLTLDHSTLTLAPVGANVVISLAVHTLTLINGARIVTNGNSLRLQAVRLVVSNGSMISFPDMDLAPPEAPAGAAGKKGLSGGSVWLRAEDGLDGAFRISLPGQNGGRGGAGLAGLQGMRGDKGSNAGQRIDCGSGGGDGGPGKPGQPGTAGSPGGDAGDGGSITLVGKLSIQRSSVHFDAPKGVGGAGGTGGAGGPGGPGGEGGDGSFSCSGGRGGPQGPPGPSGPDGAKGNDGKPGTLLTGFVRYFDTQNQGVYGG